MICISSALAEAPLATAFGTLGLAGQLTWPLLRSRHNILAAQLGIAASYAAQYALLGQWTGTGVCTIGASQTLLTLAVNKGAAHRFAGLGFVPAAWLVGYLTWGGPATGLAIIACSLLMLGRVQRDTLRMRAVMLAAAPFGIGYDIAVGALPALAGALMSACIAAAALRREWRARSSATDSSAFSAHSPTQTRNR